MNIDFVLGANLTEEQAVDYLASNGEVALQNDIFNELAVELEHDPLYDAEVLRLKVKDSIREFKRLRNYAATSLSQDKIVQDMYNNFAIIKEDALVQFNRRGTEGESVHYENTVHRSYEYERFRGVIAYCKVLF